MPRRLFTVVEVDRMIPQLQTIFTEVVQLRTLLRREEERLERAGIKVSSELLEGTSVDRGADRMVGGTTSSVELRHTKARFRAYYEALAESLQRVADLGGEVKDLDMGLVDFPGRRGSDDVLLCWKLGERHLTHWHPVDAGFSSRRLIDELVPREPPPLD